MALFGKVFYPGIESYEDFQITDVSGISPAIGVMTIYPQYGVPAADGDIVLDYDGQQIVFKNCHIDAAMFQRNSNGAIVKVRFFDERWKWQFRTITGRYNIRLPNNFVNPDHEKTPRQLARLCFAALGITNYSTAALPDLARPDVDWDNANPAQELARLCDDLGCRIVPRRSDGAWVIRLTGEGQDLPDGYPIQDAGDGIDPKEAPDYIKVVTAPWRRQMQLQLETVGRDINRAWKTIKDLSYAPSTDPDTSYGFGLDPDEMSNIAPVRERQADGTAMSPQEFALESVFRKWRIKENAFNNDGKLVIAIPVMGDDGLTVKYVSRKQVILTDQLVQTYTDDLDVQHQLPSYISGTFFGELAEDGNYPPGTRIDYQGQVYLVDPEERASFSISFDPLDTDRSIVSTSKQMLYYWSPNDDPSEYVFKEAKLYLTTAVQIRDPVTWQPERYEYFKKIGQGNDKKFCIPVLRNDIQPWLIASYSSTGILHAEGTTDNKEEVDRQCKYYADALAKTFEIVFTATRTYIGLFPIDMDGKIQQVSYQISKQGADTIASKSSKHDFDIPDYRERRQRDGRKNLAAQFELLKEIYEHRQALRGTSTT